MAKDNWLVAIAQGLNPAKVNGWCKEKHPTLKCFCDALENLKAFPACRNPSVTSKRKNAVNSSPGNMRDVKNGCFILCSQLEE